MSSSSQKDEWRQFVESICERWNTGLSDKQLTESFVVKRLIFEGVVKRLRRYEDTISVRIELPKVTFVLNDGRRGFVSHLALKVYPDDEGGWSDVIVGDRVLIETEITDSENPFVGPGIAWCDVGNNEGYISIGTEDSKLLEIKK